MFFEGKICYAGNTKKGKHILFRKLFNIFINIRFAGYIFKHGFGAINEPVWIYVVFAKYIDDDYASLRLKHLRRHLRMVGFEEFQKLMLLQVADAKVHVRIPVVEKRIMICGALAGEEGMELHRRILEGE